MISLHWYQNQLSIDYRLKVFRTNEVGLIIKMFSSYLSTLDYNQILPVRNFGEFLALAKGLRSF